MLKNFKFKTSCNRLDDKVGMSEHEHVILLQLDEHLPEEDDSEYAVDSDLSSSVRIP